MSSESSDDDDEYEPTFSREHRVARKSTTNAYSTRRQVALARSKSKKAASDRFMENFNPETSVREKRKLIRKINPPSNVRRPTGALFDENGVHIQTVTDLCDCLNEDCVGCFLECPKCGSQKCGPDCRVHRKFVIDQIEYHGYDIVIKCPLGRY